MLPTEGSGTENGNTFIKHFLSCHMSGMRASSNDQSHDDVIPDGQTYPGYNMHANPPPPPISSSSTNTIILLWGRFDNAINHKHK